MFFWDYKSACSNNIEPAARESVHKSARIPHFLSISFLESSCYNGRRESTRRELIAFYNTFSLLNLIESALDYFL